MKGFSAVRQLLIALLAALALAPAASAQLPAVGAPGTAPSAAQPTSPPPAQPAKMSVRVEGAAFDRGTRYSAAEQRLRVSGTIRPFVAGERVTVVLYRGRRIVARTRVAVKSSRDGGSFATSVAVRRSGSYAVRAYHSASERQEKATTKKVGFRAFRGAAAGGSRGAKVRLLQKRLASMGYVTSRGGRYDAATARAVLAYRKVNRLGRTTRANKTVFMKALQGRGTFKLRYPRAGKHVEFDFSRQVLVLARGGRAERIYHTSSGAPSTPTVFGTWRFYRKQPGTNAKGMVHSSYWVRGYAIHGYKSVPTYPASHGCLRVPIPNALSIYRWVKIGDRIFSYR